MTMRVGVLLLLLSACLWATPTGAKADVPRMSVEELQAQLGAEDLVILDVRSGGDWTSSEYKLPDAVRVDPADPQPALAGMDKTKRYVLYCA